MVVCVCNEESFLTSERELESDTSLTARDADGLRMFKNGRGWCRLEMKRRELPRPKRSHVEKWDYLAD